MTRFFDAHQLSQSAPDEFYEYMCELDFDLRTALAKQTKSLPAMLNFYMKKTNELNQKDSLRILNQSRH